MIGGQGVALPHLGEERPPIEPALPAKERVATAEGLVTGGCHRGHSARSGNSRAACGNGSAARSGRARGVTTRARRIAARTDGSGNRSATGGNGGAARCGRARRIAARADGSGDSRATRRDGGAARSGRARGITARARRNATRACGVRAGRCGVGLVRAVALLLFVAAVEAHRVVFDREGAANARGGVENDVHALDHRGADALFVAHSLSATQRGAERTEIAEADAASLLEAVDDLDLEGIDHGFDVGRSEGTFLFDALDDFDAVVSRCGDELRVEEDVAGLDVLAANNMIG